jgi:hypothetical protein
VPFMLPLGLVYTAEYMINSVSPVRAASFQHLSMARWG